MIREELDSKILDHTAVLAVIGLGYVGLPLVVGFAQQGYRVIGVDADERKVDLLATGRSPLEDIADEEIAALVDDGRFDVTSDYAQLSDADVIFVCVPTPFTAMKAPDLTYVEVAARGIAETLRPGQLVILQSTTYPGTSEEVVLPILAASGLEVGRDFFLAFSPERIDPGQTSSAGYTVQNTPKVVGGVTDECVSTAALLLSQMIASVHCVSSTRAAEMTKLLENTFRSVNIALVNELAVLAERMGIDIWEVIEAASSKPFGFMPFTPGPGVGGHCIPVDPFYLSWKAREFDYYAKFIELAAEVNNGMSRHAFSKIALALNQSGRAVRGSEILVIGVAFKPNVDDARNSPAQAIIELLAEEGATVRYHDPHVRRLEFGGNYSYRPVGELYSEELTPELLAGADCVVLVTAHRGLDIPLIIEHSRVLVDTVNATSGHAAPADAVIRLGAPTPNSATVPADATG